ncbi:hypothetical protein N7519_007433 [Penicillium mononematosum]|uniref:uncharacterized protein n=1 Tax=Penicillium mononematosum TaxID=268346 RepID=UPI002546DCA7|nr:uncharacterized protein N7519_007433 [Penicillium mononematosum]KAJ6186132.1 hypothetical protein N7519_007433 [Penicillium mononematosum]
MASQLMNDGLHALLRRAAEDSDPDDAPEAGSKEITSSWALFIMIMLLMFALFTSYILQQKKIQAVHETVLSIFAGMFVGLLIRFTDSTLQDSVAFDYQFFFNLLLPPIILASGYELHQANFFRHIGTILTFAFAGTFISAIALGLVLYLWTRIPLSGLDISFVEAISVGATLSATDPVTILAIFNLYKVEPKLYTIIFGESILNDAIAIVLFETAQRYHETGAAGSLTFLNIFEAVGLFLLVFFGSMVVGMLVGIATALGLKYTLVRRLPKIESCLIILVAYASYFFSNGVHLSGIVSLLFCGITLKHYAYYNMSRRTQLTTKYLFQVMAQLSENFIFIYLGLDLFVEPNLQFNPLFILVAVFGICLARYLAVFPLSKAINWFIRYRARRRGVDVPDELPFAYQAMLYWAGLRGAVGVALAAGLSGVNAPHFILGIRTGVVEELDSDDEFDTEVTHGGTYYKRSGTSLGYIPRRADSVIPMDGVTTPRAEGERTHSYSSGNSRRPSPPYTHTRMYSAAYSNKDQSWRDRQSAATLLNGASGPSAGEGSDDEFGLPPSGPGRSNDPTHPDEFDLDIEGVSDDDLPPAASGASRLRRSASQPPHPSSAPPTNAAASTSVSPTRQPVGMSARDAVRGLFSGGASGDHAAWFRQLDEDYIKPTLLLDQSNHKGPGPGAV